MTANDLRPATVKDVIDRLWWEIGRACDRVRYVNAQWKWSDLNEIVTRQEREHIAFGRRLLKHNPSRKTTLKTRTRYFAVKVVLNAEPAPKSWEDVDSLRDDFVKGAALRHYLDKHTPYWWFAISPEDYALFQRIEYAEHLAGR